MPFPTGNRPTLPRGNSIPTRSTSPFSSRGGGGGASWQPPSRQTPPPPTSGQTNAAALRAQDAARKAAQYPGSRPSSVPYAGNQATLPRPGAPTGGLTPSRSLPAPSTPPLSLNPPKPPPALTPSLPIKGIPRIPLGTALGAASMIPTLIDEAKNLSQQIPYTLGMWDDFIRSGGDGRRTSELRRERVRRGEQLQGSESPGGWSDPFRGRENEDPRRLPQGIPPWLEPQVPDRKYPPTQPFRVWFPSDGDSAERPDNHPGILLYGVTGAYSTGGDPPNFSARTYVITHASGTFISDGHFRTGTVSAVIAPVNEDGTNGEPVTPDQLDPPSYPMRAPADWAPPLLPGALPDLFPQAIPQAIPQTKPVPQPDAPPAPAILPPPAPSPRPQRIPSLRPAPLPSLSPSPSPQLSPSPSPQLSPSPSPSPYPQISPTPSPSPAPSPSPSPSPQLNPPRVPPPGDNKCCPSPMEKFAAISLAKVHDCDQEAGSSRVSVPNPMIEVVKFLAQQMQALGELVCTTKDELSGVLNQVKNDLEGIEFMNLEAKNCNGETVDSEILVGQRINVLSQAIKALNRLNNARTQVLCAAPGAGDDEYVALSIPIATYNPNGTVEISQASIQVRSAEQSQVTRLFEQIASVKSYLSGVERYSERIHNVLGGSTWFGSNAANRTPSLPTKAEEKMKADGVLMGMNTDTEKSVAANSLLDLFRLYSAVNYHRMGLNQFPAEVPETLLTYSDKRPAIKIRSLSEYLGWFVQQVDGLVGQFPIEVTIEDIDPLQKGNQTKKIELANISEALAEMYGQGVSTQLNSSVSINFLMRLASEVIATKNSSLITQDYVRANAAFLGYKGNPKKRVIDYSFNPSKLETLDEFLQESKGNIVGWDEDDKESVVSYLQKIVFSAGIIKAVFMRSPKQLHVLKKEFDNLVTQEDFDEKKVWEAFLKFLNDPNSFVNLNQGPMPNVKDKGRSK